MKSVLFVKMQKDPAFNHHAKCEKMGITHLTFADDVLMFCGGDVTSVDMMKVLHTFADTTEMVVNPRKCKVFFGGVDIETRNKIKELTTYEEGLLPFRYIGVPLITRKLNIKHYPPLIDKILAKVKHWSSRLLSMAGRMQLVQNTVIIIAQFLMQCLPIPKYVIKRIDSICRSFVWIGKVTVSKKSPIAWESVCKPKSLGGAYPLPKEETLDGGCNTFSKAVWKHVLQWLGITHEPQPWSIEIGWIMHMIAKKGWRYKILKIAVAETIYDVWQYRNEVIFGKYTHRNTSIDIGERIIEKVMYRGWYSPNLRKHIATLML
ncbi:uncharacterized protein LOC131613336 [Vicia villosa]|uniref:uncharacterized protein LOC131613336 n=1 Tax=Vicia villosa TaxID=3911 RepID=UPI00273C291B|nr:uncharacterized protein LOC131613336 [Vicia villosa]